MPVHSFTDDMFEKIAKDNAEDVLMSLAKKRKDIDTFVDFVSQVLNGGIEQWIGNRFISKSDYEQKIKTLIEVAKYSKKYGSKLNKILKSIKEQLDGIVNYLPITLGDGYSVRDIDGIFGLDEESVFEEQWVGEDEYGEDQYESYADPHDLAAIAEFNEAEEIFNKLDSEFYGFYEKLFPDIVEGIKNNSKSDFKEVVENQTGLDLDKLKKEFEMVRKSGFTNMGDMRAVIDLAKTMRLSELSKLSKMKRNDAAKVYKDILMSYMK